MQLINWRKSIFVIKKTLPVFHRKEVKIETQKIEKNNNKKVPVLKNEELIVEVLKNK